MTPRCYNRPPFAGYWERHGVALGSGGGVKPRYRFRWFPFEQRCAAWDCPPGESPVPERERWACGGCRWQPERATDALPPLRDVIIPIIWKTRQEIEAEYGLHCATTPSGPPRIVPPDRNGSATTPALSPTYGIARMPHIETNSPGDKL